MRESIHEIIDIYCDGPNLEEIDEFGKDLVKGHTFNPTLFRNQNVEDYLGHSYELVKKCEPLPVSLEVFADDKEGMIEQAGILNELGENVFIKIPITYTSGETTLPVIRALAEDGFKLNITAVFHKDQIEPILFPLRDTRSIISVFSGRLFDIGMNAVEVTKHVSGLVHENSKCKVLWASPRMVYDTKNAIDAECDIITMKPSLIRKLALFEKSWKDYSLDTVKMFFLDAQSSKYSLK